MKIEARPATACHRYSSLRKVSDAELLARCRIGEEDAWSELVVRFSPQVYAIARRAFGLGSHDAEEIFQETFVRAYEHLHQLRDGHAFGFWIRQITRRLCIDHLRRPWHPPLTEDDLESLPGEDHLEDLDEAIAVHQALARLSTPACEVLDRFFFRDEPYESISKALALPYGTIASRISRGLDKLRTDLDVEDEARKPAGVGVRTRHLGGL